MVPLGAEISAGTVNRDELPEAPTCLFPCGAERGSMEMPPGARDVALQGPAFPGHGHAELPGSGPSPSQAPGAEGWGGTDPQASRGPGQHQLQVPAACAAEKMPRLFQLVGELGVNIC